MRKQLHRRRIGGMPCMLLALLVLFARLVSPSMAMPGSTAIVDFDRLAASTICHVAPADEPAGESDLKHKSPSGDCTLCPACHIAGQALLPAPEGLVVQPPGLAAIGLAAPPPPATAPPARARTADHPTGPPVLSI